jgi:8-oxo-dGTP diphosphatase
VVTVESVLDLRRTRIESIASGSDRVHRSLPHYPRVSCRTRKVARVKNVTDASIYHAPSTVQAVMDGNLAGITLDRPRVIVDVNLLIVGNGQILLGRRCGTGFADGQYSVPAGHLELGESVVLAAVREAKEELNINVDPNEIRFVQVMHNSYGIGRLAFFFEIERWDGNIANMEPHKCDDLHWFDPGDLPVNMVPYIREAIGHYLNGRALTLYGW